MQIVVVSDNHSNKEVLDRIVNMYPKANLYLHLGDSEMYEHELYPFVSVKGNNDYYIENEFRIIEYPNFKAYLTHGHKLHLSLDNMVSKARINCCNFFIFGHIHKPFYEIKDGIHILCPGSLNYPRSAIGETYAIIDINDKINVEIKQL